MKSTKEILRKNQLRKKLKILLKLDYALKKIKNYNNLFIGKASHPLFLILEGYGILINNLIKIIAKNKSPK